MNNYCSYLILKNLSPFGIIKKLSTKMVLRSITLRDRLLRQEKNGETCNKPGMGKEKEFILLGEKIGLVSDHGDELAELVMKLVELLGVVTGGKMKAAKGVMDRAELFMNKVGVERSKA